MGDVTSQPQPQWQQPSEPFGNAYETYADPVTPSAASSPPTWEQPSFTKAPPVEVLTGDVIVPGERPQTSAVPQWLRFVRHWGFIVALFIAIFTPWHWFFLVAIACAVLPRIIADIPRHTNRPGDPQATMRVNREQFRTARQQYRSSARQARAHQRQEWRW